MLSLVLLGAVLLCLVLIPVVYSDISYIYQIKIAERSGIDLSDYAVEVKLNVSDLIRRGVVLPDFSNIWFISQYGTPLYYWLETPAAVDLLDTWFNYWFSKPLYLINDTLLLLALTSSSGGRVILYNVTTGAISTIHEDSEYRFTIWDSVYVPRYRAVFMVGSYVENWTAHIVRSCVFAFFLVNKSFEYVCHPDTGEVNEFRSVEFWTDPLTGQGYLVVGERVHGGNTSGSAYPHGGGIWLIPISSWRDPSTWRRIWQSPHELGVTAIRAADTELYIVTSGTVSWHPGAVEVWRYDYIIGNFTLLLNLTGYADPYTNYTAYLDYDPVTKLLYIAVSYRDGVIRILVVDPVKGSVLKNITTDVPWGGHVYLTVRHVGSHAVAFITSQNSIYLFDLSTNKTRWIGDVGGFVGMCRYCFTRDNLTFYFTDYWGFARDIDYLKVHTNIYRARLGHTHFWVKLPAIPAHGIVWIYACIGDTNPYPDYENPAKVFVFFDDFKSNTTLTQVWTFYAFEMYWSEEPYSIPSEAYVYHGILRLRKYIDTSDYAAYLAVRLPELQPHYTYYVSIRARIVDGFDHVLIAVIGNSTDATRLWTRLNYYLDSVEILGNSYYVVPGGIRKPWTLWWRIEYTYQMGGKMAVRVYVPYSRFDTGYLDLDRYTPDTVYVGLGQGRGAARGVSVEMADVDWVWIRKVIKPEPLVQVMWLRPNKLVLKVHNVTLPYVLVNDIVTIELPSPGNVTVYDPEGNVYATWTWVTDAEFRPDRPGTWKVVIKTVTGTFQEVINATYGNLTVTLRDIRASVLDYLPLSLRIIYEGRYVSEFTKPEIRVRTAAGFYIIEAYAYGIKICYRELVINTLNATVSLNLTCSVFRDVDYSDAHRTFLWSWDKRVEIEWIGSLPYSITHIKVSGKGPFTVLIIYERPPTDVSCRSNITVTCSWALPRLLVIQGELHSTADIVVEDLYKLTIKIVDTLGNLLTIAYAIVNGTIIYSGESRLLPAGIYLVTTYRYWNDFKFKRWVGGPETELLRVLLVNDTVLTAVYFVPVKFFNISIIETWRDKHVCYIKVSGQLLNYYGDPIPHRLLYVTVEGPDTNYTMVVYTDAEGRFETSEFALRQGQTYRIKVVFPGDEVYLDAAYEMSYLAGKTVTSPVPVPVVTGVSWPIFIFVVLTLAGIIIAIARKRRRAVVTRTPVFT